MIIVSLQLVHSCRYTTPDPGAASGPGFHMSPTHTFWLVEIFGEVGLGLVIHACLQLDAARRCARSLAAADPHKPLHERFYYSLVVYGGVTDLNKN